MAKKVMKEVKLMQFTNDYLVYNGTSFEFNVMAQLNEVYSYKVQKVNYQNGITVKKNWIIHQYLILLKNKYILFMKTK